MTGKVIRLRVMWVEVVVVEATKGPNAPKTPEATEGAEPGEATNPPEMKKSKKKTRLLLYPNLEMFRSRVTESDRKSSDYLLKDKSWWFPTKTLCHLPVTESRDTGLSRTRVSETSFLQQYVNYEDESPMVLQEVPGPMIIKTSFVNPFFLTSEFVSQLIVQDLLFGINIPYSVFNLLKTEISSLACSLARLDVRMGKLVWPITLDVRVTSSIPYEDFDFDYELEEPFEDLEEETIFRIVPAKRSSVEALDKIEFLGQGSGTTQFNKWPHQQCMSIFTPPSQSDDCTDDLEALN
ncbi:hypothetical protein Scep_007060 [Stephania cephalantha]|uniref:Uncharacterized protein n=1 Tax=Stephania cephalantha TaxID=152367 RepID=A0AAP0K913_9MAGN